MGGPIVDGFANALVPYFAKKGGQLFSDATPFLDKFFGDGEAGPDRGVSLSTTVSGASEVRWMHEFGRSAAAGAAFTNDWLPGENRAYGTTTVPNFRHSLPLDWCGEQFAWYFAEIFSDLAINDAGALAGQAMAQSKRAYEYQRAAAERLVRKMWAWHLFSLTSANALAVVDANAALGATAFVARRATNVANEGHRGAYCLGRNSPFVIVDPITGAVRGGANGGMRCLSVAVNLTNGDTVNTTAGLPAAIFAGDLVCEGDSLRSSFARGITPIPVIAGTALDSEMVHGQSRVRYPQLSATQQFNPALAAFRGAAVALVENIFMNMLPRANVEGEEPYVAIMAPGLAMEFATAPFRVANALAIQTAEQPIQEGRRYIEPTMDVMYGVKHFKFLCASAPGGVIDILTDPDVTPNRIIFLRRSDWAKWSFKAPGWLPGTLLDGQGFRVPNVYRGFATFSMNAAITCHNIPAQCVVRQVGHNQIGVAQGGDGAAASIL